MIGSVAKTEDQPPARARRFGEMVDKNIAQARYLEDLIRADARLELLEASDESSTIAKFVAKRGPGLHHIAVRVRNFEEVLARLRAAGARLLNEPRAGAGGHRYVFVHPESTGGVLLELIKENDS